MRPLPLRLSLVVLSLCVSTLVTGEAGAANVLLVTNGGTLSSEESARKTLLESWGHTVATIEDASSQSAIDAAIAVCDVVYLPEEASSSDIGYKFRGTALGVVSEEKTLDDEFGFATSPGIEENSTSLINVINTTHFVSSGVASGLITIFNSTQPRILMQGTYASGGTTLAQSSSGNPVLFVVDRGGTLANTYSGSSSAAGRRVRLPWGGDNFSFSSLDADGQSILRQAIAWASNQLVLHLKLDETSGTVADDSSSLNNDGAYLNGTVKGVAGVRGSAARFDGIDDRVEVPGSSTLDLRDRLTVACWAKSDTATWNTWGCLVSKRDQFILHPVAGSQILQFYVHVAGSGWAACEVNLASIPGFSIQKWHHYVGVCDNSTGAIRVFVDGQLLATSTITAGATLTPDNGIVAIGADDFAGRYFAGSIDDVRIYNCVLTNAQIAEVHGLIAHWKLNETTGTTADDSTLSNHDATLTGTQGWTTGKDGGGHDFDYVTGEDYFTAPTTTALDNVQEDDYTIMAYVKPNSLPPGTGSANNGAYAIVSKEGFHVGLKYDNAGNFYVEHWLGTTPTWAGTGSWGTTYPPGSFYHVAAVVSRTNGTIKLFVDGVLINTGTFTPGSAAYEYNSNRWRIGISGPAAASWGHAADAVIDDARIYNRALSDEEMSAFASPGLVAHWKFDETSGTAVADSSGNGHNGAFNTGTPTWVSGVRGNAIQFNGSNDADTNASFPAPGSGSVAFWYRFNAQPVSTQRLFGLGTHWEVRVDSAGVLYMDLGGDGSGGFQTAVGSAVPGEWRHVVAVYNDAADTYKLYLDGKLFVSGSKSIAAQTSAILSFGTRTGTTERFNGALDGLRVYNYELSTAEVAELYGLVGHWKFDEGTGTTVADSSGAAAHAAFGTGAPVWISGVRGHALDFDGTTDAQTLSAFSPPAEGSIAFWIRSQSPPTANRRILGLGGDWEARMYPDGMIYFDFCGDSPAGALTVLPIPHDGRWQHVVHVFDSDDNSFTTYLNGQLASTGVATVDRVPQAAANLSFGTRTGSTERFTGALDDVRVYNRSLQPREIADLYGLVGHWKLGEVSGSVAADSSGYDRDGAYAGVQLGHPGPTSDLPLAARIVPGSVVDLTSQSKFNLRESLGVAFWMKLNSISESWHPLGWEESPSYDAYRLYMSDDRSWGLQLNPGTSVPGAVGTDSLMTGTAQIGAWAHYAASYSGSEIVLYRNGVKISQKAVTGVTVGETITTMFLGNQPQGGVEAEMADFRLYNRAFFPGETRQLYYGDWTPGLRIVKWLEVPNP